MQVIYLKENGSIYAVLDDLQEIEVYFQFYTEEFISSIDSLKNIEDVPMPLHNYYVDTTTLTLAKYTDAEIEEIEVYGKVLTEIEREEIHQKEQGYARERIEQQSINEFARFSFDMMLPSMSQTQVLQFEPLVEDWNPGKYEIGDIRKYTGQVWRCVQGHDNANNAGIIPGQSPAHWSPHHSKDIRYAKEYIQPAGAHDAYMSEEYCIYKSEIYRSKIDNNVWSPKDYPQGWELIEDASQH